MQPYDDGAFVGYIRSYERCGGTATRMVDVFANPVEGVDFTAYLSVQLTGAADDTATLEDCLVVQLGQRRRQPDRCRAGTPKVGRTGPGWIDEARQMVADQFGCPVTDERGSASSTIRGGRSDVRRRRRAVARRVELRRRPIPGG